MSDIGEKRLREIAANIVAAVLSGDDLKDQCERARLVLREELKGLLESGRYLRCAIIEESFAPREGCECFHCQHAEELSKWK